MSAAPEPEPPAVDLRPLRDFYRKQLLLKLKAIGDKRLYVVFDPSLKHGMELKGPLELCLLDTFKTFNVERKKTLSADPIPEDELEGFSSLVYFVRPTLEVMRVLASHIRVYDRRARGNATGEEVAMHYHVFMLPRKTFACERELERLGVYGDVTLHEFPLGLLPLDTDVLSLEAPAAVRECFVEGDVSCLSDLAQSLTRLQLICGWIPRVQCKGDHAVLLFQMMQRLQREQAAVSGYRNSLENLADPCFDRIVILDRSADMVTPLLTQLTYEGLLDEVYGISCNQLKPDSKTGVILLSSRDALYEEIRNVNFRVLGPLLGRRAAAVKETYNEWQDAKNVPQMHSFIKKFKVAHNEHNHLQTHINLADRVSKITRSTAFDRRLEIERLLLDGELQSECEQFIAALIGKKAPLTEVLRMICLLSQTSNLKRAKLDFYKREVTQTYGYKHVVTFKNLERAGMLNASGSARAWFSCKKSLRLMQDTDLQQPTSISYAYSGYASLNVRLIEYAANSGWQRLEETLNLLKGTTYSTTNAAASISSSTSSSSSSTSNPLMLGPDKPTGVLPDAKENKSKKHKGEVVLVVFIGGVTFAEISALRHLSKREGHPCKYVVATTRVITGDRLVQAALPRY